MTNLTDIMVDIETLGTSPNAMIVQIAAVRFDPATRLISSPEGAFNFHVKPTGSPAIDGDMDFDTVRWWLSQEPAAQQRVFAPATGFGGHVGTGVMAFCAWVEQQGPFEHVWANAPTFDLVLLKRTFDRTLDSFPRIGMEGDQPLRRWPFTYKDERDFRTLKTIGRRLGVPEPVRVGVSHDALDDCFHQVAWAMDILAATTLKGKPWSL